MFRIIFGNGDESATMDASGLNDVFDRGIIGCGGAGRIEAVIVDGQRIDWPIFKAIYNAGLVCNA